MIDQKAREVIRFSFRSSPRRPKAAGRRTAPPTLAVSILFFP